MTAPFMPPALETDVAACERAIRELDPTQPGAARAAKRLAEDAGAIEARLCALAARVAAVAKAADAIADRETPR